MDVSSYNAFVPWGEINPTRKIGKLIERRIFLEELRNPLITPLLQKWKHLSRSTPQAEIAIRTRASTSNVEVEEQQITNKRNRCVIFVPLQRMLKLL